MKLPFMTRESVDSLQSAVNGNLDAYRSGETKRLVPDSLARESRVEVHAAPSLIKADGSFESDATAARLIYQWLQKLDVTQASDGRLWTYLTHATFADYVYKRWWGRRQEESDKPEDVVLDRWFFRGEGSATFFRNGIARLWWFAYLTYDSRRGNHFELTDVLLSLQDIQQAFLERSLGRCRPLLQVILQTIQKYDKNPDFAASRGDKVKRWAVEINKVGGAYILDVLPTDRCKFIVERQLQRSL